MFGSSEPNDHESGSSLSRNYRTNSGLRQNCRLLVSLPVTSRVSQISGFQSLTLGPKKSDSRVLTQVWDSLYICWCWFLTRQDLESPRAYTFGHVCEGVSRLGEIEVGRPALPVSGIVPYPGVLDRKKTERGEHSIGLSLLPDRSVCPAVSKFLPLWLLCQRGLRP